MTTYTANELGAPPSNFKTNNKMKLSSLFTLNWKDVGKALIMLFATTFGNSVLQVLELGHLPNLMQLKASATVAGVATLIYLIKNFVTNDKGELFSPNRLS